ncbi:GIYc domain containing protein [Methylobacterium oryzae CBMB20]|uniref:GIYc domain containing protein n=1 Tax=Methylobacterium oryzae CBMB20 TaxID=693986 RepID=A0A089NXU4_9HYPH|nr:GIYc domain containing protein [Methylobacterium oryzae CBMB20]
MREPAVYIMASRRNGTLYTGVTSNLARRGLRALRGAAPGLHQPLRLQAPRLV